MQLLNDATHFASNNSLLVLTAANGQQLIRTDNMPLVNVSSREHFQAAMQKQDYISDIILSMSTGELITVLEVPVLDSRQHPIGMVQCNYDLLSIQNFVQKNDDEFSALLVFDKNNQIVSHSEFNLTSIEERQAAQVYIAFFMISLDNYQQICQASQHKYDTDILIHFSRSLRDIFRSGDIIGRLDEACFMIILDQLKETDIVLRKGALITQAARQLTIDGQNLQLTASVGISLVPLHGKTFNILSHAAKQAMTEAHNAGGNTCRFAQI